MNDYQDYQHPDCVPVLPQEPFQHIALTFSGGGFRATLFHLGALRRLNELGVLTRDDFRTVAAVSGDSIVAEFASVTV